MTEGELSVMNLADRRAGEFPRESCKLTHSSTKSDNSKIETFARFVVSLERTTGERFLTEFTLSGAEGFEMTGIVIPGGMRGIFSLAFSFSEGEPEVMKHFVVKRFVTSVLYRTGKERRSWNWG
jgi:hypothetical protein